MSINVSSLLALARFFLRSKKEQTEIGYAELVDKAIDDTLALPSVKAVFAATPNLLEAEGWTTVKDPATGAVVAIDPPAQDGVRGGPRGGLMSPGT